MIIFLFLCILVGVTTTSEESEQFELFTKDGNPRKRKKFCTSLKQRKEKKLEKLKCKHQVLPPCKETYRHKCIEKIPEERRIEINTMFWKLGWTDRRTTICNLCERLEVKRRRGKGNVKINNVALNIIWSMSLQSMLKFVNNFFLLLLVSAKQMIELFLMF